MHLTPEQFENGSHTFRGWRIRVDPARSIATPAVADGTVIFGGGFGSHEIYAADVITGEPRWQLHTSDDGPTAAVVVDGLAFFNTESCTLMAVDTNRGCA